MEFTTIGNYNNRCDIDIYGKVVTKDAKETYEEIEDGDTVEIKWPDKTIERYKVSVREDSRTDTPSATSGVVFTIPVRAAYIKVKYNGTTIETRLSCLNNRVRIRKLRGAKKPMTSTI